MKNNITEMFWRETPDERQESQMEDAYTAYYTKKQMRLAQSPDKPTEDIAEEFVATVKTIFGVK